ncbi:MAG: hypothetical protein H6569_15375, partial [Lewinellaceae bacterium]|nr:hypothetical protein [Lewinellaceae bacterium]
MPNNLHCLFPFALFLAILPLVSQGQTLQTRNFFQQEDNRSIAVDGEFVWLGTAKSGVLQYHRNGVLLDQLTMDAGLAGNTVYAILIDQTGGRWFATDKGLSEYTQTGWKTHFNG